MKERHDEKKKLCDTNKIRLIYFTYEDDLTKGKYPLSLKEKEIAGLRIFDLRKCDAQRIESTGDMIMDEFIQAAIQEARIGLAEGGIPIGAVLVIDGKIVGRGHNRRVQKGSAVLHAEMDCFENAGRLTAKEYQRATLYSTLSPCDMCSGATLLYKIPRIVIGEHTTFRGPEDYLRSRGVNLVILDNEECIRLMHDFITAEPVVVE